MGNPGNMRRVKVITPVEHVPQNVENSYPDPMEPFRRKIEKLNLGINVNGLNEEDLVIYRLFHTGEISLDQIQRIKQMYTASYPIETEASQKLVEYIEGQIRARMNIGPTRE